MSPMTDSVHLRREFMGNTFPANRNTTNPPNISPNALVLRDQTLDHPLWTDAEEVYVERCQFINPAKRPTDGSAAINLLWNGRGVKITVRDTTFKDWFMAIGGETILPGSAIERCHLRGCTNGFQFVNAPGITIKECSG